MIDPVTDCIEMGSAPSAQIDLVSNQVELAWSTCYPLSSKVKEDKGN